MSSLSVRFFESWIRFMIYCPLFRHHSPRFSSPPKLSKSTGRSSSFSIRVQVHVLVEPLFSRSKLYQSYFIHYSYLPEFATRHSLFLQRLCANRCWFCDATDDVCTIISIRKATSEISIPAPSNRKALDKYFIDSFSFFSDGRVEMGSVHLLLLGI